MNKKLHKTVKSIVAGAFLLASTSLYSTGFAAEKPSTEGGDAGRGATAWIDNCMRCHNARDPKELRDDQWITTTYHMRIRAGLTGQETRDIIAFLQMSN
ncbi:MAG: cytochrome c [Gammaproteobacteria bacterium]|nr:cytochrome c [Gammaproteobacteria bacterium]